MRAEQIIKAVRKLIEPIRRAVQLTIGRAVLASINESTGLQKLQVTLLANEVTEIERFQNYGFTSVPLSGAEGICVFVGGNRDHGVCIAADDRRYRLKNLGAGSVAIYDSTGTKIVLTNDSKIEVSGSTEVLIKSDSKVKIDCSSVDIGSGTLEKILKGETFQAFFNSHTHVGNLGVPTSPPQVASDAAQLSQVVKGS